MATIKDVAARRRVSTATVSAVINDSAYVSPDLRSRVLDCHQGRSTTRRRWLPATSSMDAAS